MVCSKVATLKVGTRIEQRLVFFIRVVFLWSLKGKGGVLGGRKKWGCWILFCLFVWEKG